MGSHYAYNIDPHIMINIVVFIDWLIYYYVDTTQRDGSYQTYILCKNLAMVLSTLLTKLVGVVMSAGSNVLNRTSNGGEGM